MFYRLLDPRNKRDLEEELLASEDDSSSTCSSSPPPSPLVPSRGERVDKGESEEVEEEEKEECEEVDLGRLGRRPFAMREDEREGRRGSLSQRYAISKESSIHLPPKMQYTHAHVIL